MLENEPEFLAIFRDEANELLDAMVAQLLACERGLHPYEIVERALVLRVVQSSLEQGLVSLPHTWRRTGAPV